MLLIGIGVLVQVFFKRILGLDELFERILKKLVDFIYYLLIPLAFIKTYTERGVMANDLWLMASFIIFLVISMASLRLIAGHWSKDYYSALLITSIFPNAVFLGFPVSLALFGSIHVASIYGLVTLVLNVVVPDIIALGKASLIRLIEMPALLGFIIGLTGHYLFPKELAEAIVNTLWWAPYALSYTATMILGARLPLRVDVLRGNIKFIALTSIYRFMVAPLVTCIVLLIPSVDWSIVAQAIIVSMMPPAVLNTLIASKYGWVPELVASTTFILTSIVVLCLPFINLMI
jgi:predicted permease